MKIDRKFLLSSKFKRIGENLYMIIHNGKKYYIKRTGFCDYKKCGSACCKFMSTSIPKDQQEYVSGFLRKGFISYKFEKPCKRLNEDGSCRRWDSLPSKCQEFPKPNDIMYIEVFEKCTFKFVFTKP